MIFSYNLRIFESELSDQRASFHSFMLLFPLGDRHIFKYIRNNYIFYSNLPLAAFRKLAIR